jgi:hypothetical protein
MSNGLQNGLDRGIAAGTFEGTRRGELSGVVGNDSLNTMLLLDLYPNAQVAVSLRRLRRAYRGSCIRVRRSSDNSEQDFGFVNNILDTTSLLSFVGGGTGFVTVWYDQSGNGRNYTQTIAGNQPVIIIGGVLSSINSNPAVRTTLANTSQGLISPFSTLQDLPTTISVVNYVYQLPTSVFPYNFSIGGTVQFQGGGSRYEIACSNIGVFAQRRNTTGTIFSSQFRATLNKQAITTAFFGTIELHVRDNGFSTSPTAYSGTPLIMPSNFTIFCPIDYKLNGNQAMQEKVIWTTDQSRNKIGIEKNQNAYYRAF